MKIRSLVGIFLFSKNFILKYWTNFAEDIAKLVRFTLLKMKNICFKMKKKNPQKIQRESLGRIFTRMKIKSLDI
jgi:hypothetical protein